jgi:hypothetical protein
MRTVTFRTGIPWNMSDPTFRWAVHSARATMTRHGATISTVDAAPNGRNDVGRIVFELEMRPGYQTREALETAVLATMNTLRHFRIDVSLDEADRAL